MTFSRKLTASVSTMAMIQNFKAVSFNICKTSSTICCASSYNGLTSLKSIKNSSFLLVNGASTASSSLRDEGSRFKVVAFDFHICILRISSIPAVISWSVNEWLRTSDACKFLIMRSLVLRTGDTLRLHFRDIISMPRDVDRFPSRAVPCRSRGQCISIGILAYRAVMNR